MQVEKFAYKAVLSRWMEDKEMNKLGSDDWELVSVVERNGFFTYFFKRKYFVKVTVHKPKKRKNKNP